MFVVKPSYLHQTAGFLAFVVKPSYLHQTAGFGVCCKTLVVIAAGSLAIVNLTKAVYSGQQCLCVCVRACVRACMRVCVSVRAHVWMLLLLTLQFLEHMSVVTGVNHLVTYYLHVCLVQDYASDPNKTIRQIYVRSKHIKDSKERLFIMT